MWARGRATGRGQLASAGKLAASAAPEWARVSLLAIGPVPSELSHRSQPRFSLEARPLQQRKPYPGAVRAAWDALLCGEMAPRHRLGALTVGLFTPTSFSSGLHLVKGCRWKGHSRRRAQRWRSSKASVSAGGPASAPPSLPQRAVLRDLACP